MAKPYLFAGETPHEYPTLRLGGPVQPGDIAYFSANPPDERWRPYSANDIDPAGRPVAVEDEPETVVRRPNKAAPKADWQDYARAQGMDPAEVDAATRTALIEQFTQPEPQADGASQEGGEGA